MRARKISWDVNAVGCFVCNSHKPKVKTDKNDLCRYPKIRMNNIEMYLHRHIYEQCFGEIPSRMIVRHKCNNTMCINPEHLEIGTHGDNMRDRQNSGRTAIGTRSGTAKLSEQQVIDIRMSKSKTIELAKIYSVSRQTITSVKKHQTYKDVSCYKPNV